MQPILIAAGGGGASARIPSTEAPNVSANAQGLIDPWASLENWKALVPNSDIDAGNIINGLTKKCVFNREQLIALVVLGEVFFFVLLCH